MTIKRLLFTLALAWAALAASAQVNTNRMMQVGRNALYFEDYVLSIQYFNRVIIVKPYLAEPYYFRAVAKYYLDDLNGCVADCSVALDINPFLIDAYNLRGIANLRLDKPTSARKDFDAGLVYEPENVNMLMNAGIASINLKEYDEALARYDKLLEYDRRNVPAILYRGIALVEKGDTAKAMSEFERALEINAYSTDAMTYVAMLQHQTKQYADAIRTYDKLLEMKPKDVFLLVNRAIARYNTDDLAGCEADLTAAIEADRKCKMAYQNRGMLRAEVGDYNRAVDDFSRALALDPSDDIILFNRANIYVELGEANNAIRDLNIIIAKHPDFGPAYQQRAVVRRMLGDSKGAELDYMTAMNFEQERIKRGLAASNAQNADDEADKSDADASDEKKERKRESRSKNDNDLKKYDQMVVVADFEDHDDKLSQGNAETIRGRVQDRDIVIDLEPAFALTFFAADTLLPNAPYFSPSVQRFNASRLTEEKLVVSNRESTDDNVSAAVFGMIADVRAKIDDGVALPDLYMLRGTLSAIVMSYNDAIADLSVCLIKDPDNVNALFNRAAARYRMVETIRGMEVEAAPQMTLVNGEAVPMPDLRKEVTVLDYDLILKDLRRVVELEPSNAFAYFNMSLVLCQRRDMDGAMELLGKAIALNPQLAEAYFNRGLIAIYLGNEEDGVADLSRAGELGMFKAYNVIKRYAKRD